jgi:hypothetical protein
MVTTGSRLQKICAYLFLLATFLPHITVAQEADESGTRQEPDAIDEIVVMGGRSLTLLRHEVTQAEDVFYDRYNFLNEDDRYDMICKDETPIGTRIPVRVCKTRVIRDAEIQATQDGMIFGPANIGSQPVIPGANRHNEVLQEKLRAFAISDPELQDALMDYDRLSKKYAVERGKKFD